MDVQQVKEKLLSAFPEQQAGLLAEVFVEAIRETQRDIVRARDFNELKEIVRELAEAQKRTEQRLEELSEAQKRTEQRLEELAVAQKELAEAQRKTEEEIRRLTKEMGNVKTELGGLSRSVGYALENEAYRNLPGILREYGIEVTERFVRKEVNGEEINILGFGRRNGREVVIVGESALRLTGVGRKFAQLERKANLVRERYPGREVVEVLVTHYASSRVQERAKEKGIILIQSFEWQ
ncbi:MAG: Uncharacterized protein XD63_1203 [Thermoanaerobacterales bacterium 50_218]|nr:MAG: Uncharacterized protein XD63_1203 [Thermoanaerobacterales bacterium 50_218]HAA89231.1 hypothetical protein [Peptococcaceae bacterium]